MPPVPIAPQGTTHRAAVSGHVCAGRFTVRDVQRIYTSSVRRARAGGAQIRPTVQRTYTIAMAVTPLTNVTPPKEISAAFNDIRESDVHTQK